MITATPDPNPAASVRHIRLTVALLLAALLALLWWTGHGPFAGAGCCGVPAASVPAAVVPPVAVTPPPAPVAEPPPAPAPVEPATEGEPVEAVVAAPEPPAAPAPSATEPVAEAPAEQPVAEAVPAESAAPPAAIPVESAPVVEQPPYTVSDPNAQVRTNAVALAPWTGAAPSRFEHFVYYPPEKPAVVEPLAVETPVAAPVPVIPPKATLYFATSKWDLPADTETKLAPIIAYLQANPAASAVIQGFHDPRGDAETNAFLAKNRAGAIWNALTAAGISAERVIMDKPQNTTGTGSLAEARRAEVSVRTD